MGTASLAALLAFDGIMSVWSSNLTAVAILTARKYSVPSRAP